MIVILSICLGLCVGSFIHVAYSRFSPHKLLTPHGGFHYLYDISVPRSSCSCCQTKLAYWQLMPILSWLFLRGRCYYCQEKIALNYVVIETAMALLFTIILLDKGISYYSLLLLFLACWFILLALIDYRHYLLPDFLTQPLMWLGLFLSFWEVTNLSLEMALEGILIGYLLLKIPATLFYLITKKTGLGHGDIKLLAALGAWIPYFQLPFVLVIATTLGIIYYLWVRYVLNNRLLTFIPFGPCLLAAGYILIYFC